MDVIFWKVHPSIHLPFVWGKDKEYDAKIPVLLNLTKINETLGQTWKDIYSFDGIDCYSKPDNEEGQNKEQIEYSDGFI